MASCCRQVDGGVEGLEGTRNEGNQPSSPGPSEQATTRLEHGQGWKSSRARGKRNGASQRDRSRFAPWNEADDMIASKTLTRQGSSTEYLGRYVNEAFIILFIIFVFICSTKTPTCQRPSGTALNKMHPCILHPRHKTSSYFRSLVDIVSAYLCVYFMHRHCFKGLIKASRLTKYSQFRTKEYLTSFILLSSPHWHIQTTDREHPLGWRRLASRHNQDSVIHASTNSQPAHNHLVSHCPRPVAEKKHFETCAM